jgi:hypothetical protein
MFPPKNLKQSSLPLLCLDKLLDTKQEDRLEDIWKGLSVEQRRKLLERVAVK